MIRFLHRWYHRLWHNVDPARDEAQRAQAIREQRFLTQCVKSERFQQKALDQLRELSPKFAENPNISPRTKLAVALFGALLPLIMSKYSGRRL